MAFKCPTVTVKKPKHYAYQENHVVENVFKISWDLKKTESRIMPRKIMQLS